MHRSADAFVHILPAKDTPMKGFGQKELPRVNRTQDPVEDQKSQLRSFSENLLEFCSILVKVNKNVHFT